jgi:hypothetical protein
MEEHRCKNLLASLSDYVDGSLSENLCTEIERHMAGCENSAWWSTSAQNDLFIPGDHRPVLPTMRQRLFSRLIWTDFATPGSSANMQPHLTCI